MDPLPRALSCVAAALDALRVPYLIGGPLASSAHGVLRATMDVDILARIEEAQAAGFAAALGRIGMPMWK